MFRKLLTVTYQVCVSLIANTKNWGKIEIYQL